MSSILGLTGGIATGKSTFARIFSPQISAIFFDADACVHELLETEDVRAALRAEIHPEAAPDGQPVNRGLIRSVVFEDAGKKKTLENILHPRVRERWMAQAAECRASGRNFLADIPLLFETGAESHFDAVIVVACSGEVRMQRLLQRPGMTEETAKKMIASQAPLGDKIAKAHHVVWNDGSLQALQSQSDFLSRLFHVPNG